ncbi:hypothetical protein CVIRNUC_004174 [Coccomyxa viridis]|uniref:Protein kinase domain-containing protein n=1 Tax=Coccomyxa viridis TaxID=1274662 RepID=A0AAV1I1R3_9CHLO|nr:hypothetical protein CVIRNUC_004174 [Coccomyxa viridis]
MAHPHVIQFREVLECQGLVGLVMEYAAGGALSALISARCGLPEPAARWFFQQVVIAVDFCHQKGFACQDIKLENVLIVNDARTLVKLCISRCSQGTKLHSPPGSLLRLPPTVAPEILLSAHSGSMYDGQRADMWSLGVLLFTMLTGHYPFSAQKPSSAASTSYVRSLLMGGQLRDLQQCVALGISKQCMDLLTRLLQQDPKARCRMKDVLNHPWFLSDLPPGATSTNKEPKLHISQPPC